MTWGKTLSTQMLLAKRSARKAGRVVSLQSNTVDPERVEGLVKTQGREARWVVTLQSYNVDDPERVEGPVKTQGREARWVVTLQSLKC